METQTQHRLVGLLQNTEPVTTDVRCHAFLYPTQSILMCHAQSSAVITRSSKT